MEPTTSAASMILPVHQLTPYLRVRITTDDHVLRIEHRRGLIGLIPLWTARIVVPLSDLTSADIRKHVRLQCLGAAVAFAFAIIVFDLSTIAGVALGFAAALELLLAFAPGTAIHLERADARSWTVPFCRVHAFDAAIGLEDALRRRDASASGVPHAA